MTVTWADYLALDDAALFAQCEFDRFRASGPGGQKRNKTASAVRLRHRPTGLHAEANESRSQHENRTRALGRLRLTIALALRTPVNIAAYETPSALRAALSHPPGRHAPERLPAFAALFDVLAAANWRVSDAASLLGVTTTTVTRILAVDEDVWRAASERRQAVGLSPLRHPARE